MTKFLKVLVGIFMIPAIAVPIWLWQYLSSTGDPSPVDLFLTDPILGPESIARVDAVIFLTWSVFALIALVMGFRTKSEPTRGIWFTVFWLNILASVIYYTIVVAGADLPIDVIIVVTMAINIILFGLYLFSKGPAPVRKQHVGMMN